jgi:hypothetical protein
MEASIVSKAVPFPTFVAFSVRPAAVDVVTIAFGVQEVVHTPTTRTRTVSAILCGSACNNGLAWRRTVVSRSRRCEVIMHRRATGKWRRQFADWTARAWGVSRVIVGIGGVVVVVSGRI